MADVIGTLAYKLRLDSTQFVAGMVATRGEFAAAKAIARDSATGLDVYTKAAQNLDVLLSKGLVNIAQHGAAKEKLTKEYLKQEATVRRLTSAEQAHLKTLRDLSAGTKTTAQDEANRAKIMQRGAEITEQTRSAQDRLNRSLAEARKLYREGALSAATYAKHVSDLKKNAAGAGMLGGMGGKALGTLGAITGGPSLVGVGKDAIKMTADVERAGAAMEAFTGSSAKAANMLSEIRKLSSLAGIGFRALNDGASAMMGYGVSTEVTTAKLRQFAEISRGDTERFKSLALAFGQVNAAGRLMGQEVLQMVNAGFNPLQEIARTTGIEFSTLKKMMENGQVSVDMVSKAFDTATSAGGRFNGMLDTISKTSAGSLGRMGAEWEIFLDKLGKSMPVREGANEITKGLHDASTMLSDRKDAIQQRMDDAKKDPTRLQFADDGGRLAHAAGINNALDERLINSDTNKRGRVADKLREENKAKEAARQQRVRAGMDSLSAARQASMMDMREKTNPEAFEKFGRISELLEGPKKKQATEDFAKFGNINRILPLLDRELQIELTKLDVLKQQNAARQALLGEKGKEGQKAADRKSILDGPATTAAGLTRDQHEWNSYPSQAHALAAEDQIRQAEMQQQQQMMLNRDRGMVGMLPGLEQQRNQQVQAHSPVAALSVGSQDAYKQLISGKTRADVKNDPQVKKLDQQISHLREIRDAMNKVGDKLNFEKVG